MTKIKVYLKGGRPDWRAKKYLRPLQEAIEKKIAEDPNFKFEPATNLEQLREMYNEYCTETIPFEEMKEEAKEQITEAEIVEKEDHSGSFDVTQEKVDDLNIGDLEEEGYDDIKKRENPMVRANPKIRDYVLDDSSLSSGAQSTGPQKTSFAEPTSFDESFVLPDEGEDKSGSGSKQKKDKEKKSPLNPSFDDMNPGKQRKQTKMFAKYIVEAVCTLSEKGFVWFANKDINEAKLVEYEMEGSVDLSILLTLEEGQQTTVKDWFLMMNVKAEQLAIIDQESRNDLADALAEVLLEKGIAPTPTQNLLMVAAKIFIIDKGIALLSLKVQTGSILSQLKSMKEAELKQQEEQQSEPAPVSQPERKHEEPKQEVVVDKNGIQDAVLV